MNALTKPEPAKTRGYEPIWHSWWNQVRDLPRFDFSIIRYMQIDSMVKLCLAMRTAPLSGIEFAYKDGMDSKGKPTWKPGIKADNPAVAEFVHEQLCKIWQEHLEDLSINQVWGWCAGEIVYRKHPKTKRIEIDRLVPRQAGDTKRLELDGEPYGVRFERIKSSPDGFVDLAHPYCYFLNYKPDPGEKYGTSVLLGAYSPWADKWLNGGAQDTRRLFMHKDAYGGVTVTYPPSQTPVNGVLVDNYEIALQIAEQITSGGVVALPYEPGEDGKNKWQLERATVPSNPQHIGQYPKDLDEEQRRGMEIPDDVIDDDGSGGMGSAAGRKIPMDAFLSSLDPWARSIYSGLKEQSLEQLVEWNFGKGQWFEVNHKPFAEQAMERQQQNGDLNGNGIPDNGQGGDFIDAVSVRPTNPQARLSLDPVEAVGDGIFSASRIVAAAKTLLEDDTKSDTKTTRKATLGDVRERDGQMYRLAIGPSGKRRWQRMSEFDESKHNRDLDGKFAEKEGGPKSVGDSLIINGNRYKVEEYDAKLRGGAGRPKKWALLSSETESKKITLQQWRDGTWTLYIGGNRAVKEGSPESWPMADGSPKIAGSAAGVKPFEDKLKAFVTDSVKLRGIQKETAKILSDTIAGFYESNPDLPKLSTIAGKSIRNENVPAQVRGSRHLEINTKTLGKTAHIKAMHKELADAIELVQGKLDAGALSGRQKEKAEHLLSFPRQFADHSVRGIITHEFGHFIDGAIFRRDPERRKQVTEGWRERSRELSARSYDDVGEFIAESFAAYRVGLDTDSELAEWFKELKL